MHCFMLELTKVKMICLQKKTTYLSQQICAN